MTETRSVDYRFKILYAAAMIMVVCGHAQGGGITLLKDWFPYGGLHLPIFVFCSGYFYKDSSEEHFWKYLFKKIRTLLIPLYLYTIAYGLIVQFLKSEGFKMGGALTFHNLVVAPLIHGHQFAYNMGGWFVAPLFMVEICSLLIKTIVRFVYKKTPEAFFFIVSIVLGLTGNQLACAGYNTGWWLALVRMLYFMPFYGLGTFYNRVLEKYDRKIPGFWYFTFVFAVKLGLGVYYVKMPDYSPSWCRDFSEGPVLPIIIGFLGIALWMRIASILEPVIGKSKWINLIADNTYSIMMNQFLGFMLVKTAYAYLNKTCSIFSNFDWEKYKSDIFWYYAPRGFKHTLIIYVVAGIGFSIIVQMLLNKIKYIFLKIRK